MCSSGRFSSLVSSTTNPATHLATFFFQQKWKRQTTKASSLTPSEGLSFG